MDEVKQDGETDAGDGDDVGEETDGPCKRRKTLGLEKTTAENTIKLSVQRMTDLIAALTKDSSDIGNRLKRSSSFLDDVRKNMSVRQTIKSCWSHIEKTGTGQIAGTVTDVAKQREIEKRLKAAFDAHCTTSLLLPDEACRLGGMPALL